MQGHELDPQRCQVQQAEGEGHVQAQQAAGLAAARRDLGLGFVHAPQQLAAAPVEDLTLRRQRELARGAVQEAHTQPRFQFGHMPRHRRLGHLERIRGANEAAGVDHGREHTHFLEAVHLSRILEQLISLKHVYLLQRNF
jgi:hypothetical protein